MATWTDLEHTANVLKAGEIWRDRCLLANKSVFSDQDLWTPENIQILKKLFVDNPILGDKPFYEKLHAQIKDASADVKKLAAEAVWILLLFVYEKNFSTNKKRERIAEVWKFSGEELPVSDQLSDNRMRGLASPGTAFLTKIWAEYGFLLILMEKWKSLTAADQTRLLTGNPWQLCTWVAGIEGGDVRAFRHMFLYFCYPAEFERICSNNHKKKIHAAFASRLKGQIDPYIMDRSLCNLDKSILQIRRSLEAEYNTSEIDFYVPPARSQWLRESPTTSEVTAALDQSSEPIPETKYWIEKTIVQGRPDRQAGPHRLGAALWSPQKSTDGRDIYGNMRRVNPGDIVYHLTDNSSISGVSIVASAVDKTFTGVDGTSWGQQPSYRVPLRDYKALEPRLPREAFFEDEKIRDGLRTLVESKEEYWPAPGSEDTELGVLVEPEVDHGEAEVYT